MAKRKRRRKMIKIRYNGVIRVKRLKCPVCKKVLGAERAKKLGFI